MMKKITQLRGHNLIPGGKWKSRNGEKFTFVVNLQKFYNLDDCQRLLFIDESWNPLLVSLDGLVDCSFMYAKLNDHDITEPWIEK